MATPQWNDADPDNPGKTYLDTFTDRVLDRTSFKHAPFGTACDVRDGQGKCNMPPTEILRVDAQAFLRHRWRTPLALADELGVLTNSAIGPLFDVWWMGYETRSRGRKSEGASFTVVDDKVHLWNPATLQSEMRATFRVRQSK